MSENRLKCINTHNLNNCPSDLLIFFNAGRKYRKIVFICSVTSLISHLLVLRINQALISFVTVLPFGSLMLYYMLIAELFCLPQHVPHREHTQ